jgi:hypothetical protein
MLLPPLLLAVSGLSFASCAVLLFVWVRDERAARREYFDALRGRARKRLVENAAQARKARQLDNSQRIEKRMADFAALLGVNPTDSNTMFAEPDAPNSVDRRNAAA